MVPNKPHNSSNFVIDLKSISFYVFSFLFIILFLFSFCLLPSGEAKASPNYQMNYQGKLTDATNIAVPNGSYNIQFRLCTTSDCGTVIWTEVHCYSPDNGTTCNGTGVDQRVTVTSGLFSSMIGSVLTNLSSINFNQTLYLGVTIGGSGTTPSWDPEMSPRKTLGTVPSAFESKNSDTLDSRHETEFALLAGRSGGQSLIGGSGTTDDLILQSTSGIGASGSDIILKVGNNGATEAMRILYDGKVGIGTSTPDRNLVVYGSGDQVIKIQTSSGTGNSASLWLQGAGTNATWQMFTNRADLAGAADNLAIYKGAGTTGVKLVVTDAGYVGIGTTTPSGKLDVSNGTSNFRVNFPEANWPRIYLGGVSSGVAAVFNRVDTTAGMFFGEDTDTGGYYFRGGKVGIGTSTPNANLQINGGDGVSWLQFTGWGSGTGVGDGGWIGLSGAGSPNNYNMQLGTQEDRDIEFYTNTTERMRILRSSGRVGIGTTAPGTLLQLGTAGTTAGVLSMAGSTSGLVTLQTAAAAGTWTMTLPTTAGTDTYILSTNGGGVTSWVAQGSGSGYWTASGNDIYNNNSANVGIGTASPGSKLHVAYTDDTGATGIKVGTNAVASGYVFADDYLNIGIDQNNDQSNAKFQIYHNGTISGNELFTVQENGYVGIGTTSPNEILTTNGRLSLQATTAPSATAGYGKLYVKTNDLYYMNPAGTEYALTPAGSGWTDAGSYLYPTNGEYINIYNSTATAPQMNLYDNRDFAIGNGAAMTFISKQEWSGLYNIGAQIQNYDAVGDSTLHYLLFSTRGGATLAERLRLYGNGTNTTLDFSNYSNEVQIIDPIHILTSSASQSQLYLDDSRDFAIGNGGILTFRSKQSWSGLTNIGAQIQNYDAVADSVTHHLLFSTRGAGTLAERLRLYGDGANTTLDFSNYSNQVQIIDPIHILSSSATQSQLYLDDSRDFAIGNGGILTFRSKQSWSGLTNIGAQIQNYDAVADSVTHHLLFSTRTAGSLTEKMRIGDSGNVGINTTAPAQKLSVAGTLGFIETGASPSYYTIFQGGDQSSNLTYTWPTAQGGANTFLKNDGSGTLSWSDVGSLSSLTVSGNINYSTMTQGSVIFAGAAGLLTQDNANFYWNDTDNRLGLATTGPDRRLDVLDAGNPQIRLTYTDGTVYTDLQTNSSGNLYINPSGGRVGIGVSAPTLGGLEVAGNIHASGSIGTHANRPTYVYTSGMEIYNGNVNNYHADLTSDDNGQLLVNNHFVPTGGADLALGSDSVHWHTLFAQLLIVPETYSTAVGVTNRDLYIDDTGLIGYLSSSIHNKNNVQNMEDVSWLYDLRPVNFNYKNDASYSKQYGLIAEEVQNVNPSFVSYDKDGNSETVSYSALVSPMLKAIQDQNLEVKAMKSKTDYLTVVDGAININKLVVKESATFRGKLNIESQISFNKDTVGQAKILACKDVDKTKCATSVHVTFEKEYEYQPIITITNIGKHKIQYQYVDKVTTKGFDIIIDPVQDDDTVLDWHAFGSDAGKISVSDGTTEDIKIIKPSS